MERILSVAGREGEGAQRECDGFLGLFQRKF
jgi:hypothetical protein